MKDEEEQDPLMQALDKLGHGSRFLWMIFILTVTPTMFNGMHSVLYVFTAEIPDFWCYVKALEKVKWTIEQQKRIAGPIKYEGCLMFDIPHHLLVNMTFEEAYKFTHTEDMLPRPRIPCKSYTWRKNSTHSSSIVTKWRLMCKRKALRPTTQMALSLGKLVGGILFGVFSDHHGRKISYRIGLILIMLTGPALAIIPWFWGYVVLRFLNGAGHAAITYSSFTILTEVAAEKPRQWMGIAYNTGYATGVAIMPLIAYYSTKWRTTTMAVSAPALLCVIHIWLMPESPRWLISKGRRKEARDIMQKALANTPHAGMLSDQAMENYRGTKGDISSTDARQSRNGTGSKFKRQMHEVITLTSNSEMRKRLLITNFAWLSASLCYYSLALNADNLKFNRFIYIAILGLSDIPAYILPSAVLLVFGRRQSTSLAYIVAGIFLLLILIIPRRNISDIAGLALLARFILSAGYGLIILFTSELFPTDVRNSALGSNSTMSNVGSLMAPYIADLLGAVVWWGPTTVCGSVAITAGLLIATLPETHGRPIVNTVEEEVDGERELVGVRNMWRC